MELVWPAPLHLPSYVHALERGWSPDNQRPEAGREELARIALDPDAFLAQLVDREGRGPRVVLPDGSTVARLQSWRRCRVAARDRGERRHAGGGVVTPAGHGSTDGVRYRIALRP